MHSPPRPLALFGLLITLGALWLGGQVLDPKDGPVAGTLVNSATGQVIGEAEIALNPAGAGVASTTTTDAQGRFRFNNVRFGRYTLTAAKTGYARMSYGAAALGNPGRVLAVASDRGIVDLDFSLTPLGVIQGKVVNRSGEPVPRVTIAFGFVDIYGAPPTMEALKLVTDDRGEYRLTDMPPGRYYVQALPQPPARPSDRDRGTNLPAFYPSASLFGDAQPIDLAPGQEASGIKITLREAPVFRVRGKVTGALANIAPSDLDLLLLPKDAGGLSFGQGYAAMLSRRVGGSSPVRPDGTFELRGVERGLYDLAVVAVSSPNRGTLGRVSVIVGDRDVEDLKLPLGDLAQLSLRLQSDQDLKGVACSILGLPLDGDPAAMAIMGSTGPDSLFTYDHAIPQKYALTAKCKPGNWVVKAALLERAEGVHDALDEGLDLSGGRAAVNLVLSKEAGIVVATVKENDAPVPGRWVTLIPEPPRPEKFVHDRSGWSDEGGRIIMQNVVPGDYAVYAWKQASTAASSLNPSFLKRFAAQSTRLSIKAGEQVQVEAKTVQPY